MPGGPHLSQQQQQRQTINYQVVSSNMIDIETQAYQDAAITAAVADVVAADDYCTLMLQW